MSNGVKMLSLPKKVSLLAAIGRVALRQSQLDMVLRMTVKTLSGKSPKDALADTRRWSSKRVGKKVHKLAKRRFGEGPILADLDTLLAHAKRATDRRNDVIHTAWARDASGEFSMLNETQGPIPPITTRELNKLADELGAAAKALNEARRKGFLAKAIPEAQA